MIHYVLDPIKSSKLNNEPVNVFFNEQSKGLKTVWKDAKRYSERDKEGVAGLVLFFGSFFI